MSNKILYWTPRILAILFVIFLSLFSLDVFSEYQGWVALPALLIHLLIPGVLLLAIIAAWKWDLIGVVLFFSFALFYIWQVGFNRPWSWYIVISGPAVIVGILFLLSWFQRRKKVENYN